MLFNYNKLLPSVLLSLLITLASCADDDTSGNAPMNVSNIPTGEITIGSNNGNDWAFNIEYIDDDEYYVLARQTNTVSNNFELLLIKVNASGNILWTKPYNGNFQGFGNALTVTADKGTVATVQAILGTGGSDMEVVKFDAIGEVVWNFRFDNNAFDIPDDIIELSNGDFLIISRSGNGFTTSDLWVSRISNSGELIGEYVYEINSDGLGAGIYELENGDWIIAAHTSTENGAWISRVNSSNGEIIWNKSFDDGNVEFFRGFVQLKDNEFALLLSVNSPSSPTTRIIKFDEAGELLSEYEDNFIPINLSKSREEELILIGEIAASSGQQQMRLTVFEKDNWVAKITTTVSTQDASVFPSDIIQTPDKGFLVVGFKRNSFNLGDIWIAKLNEFGEW